MGSSPALRAAQRPTRGARDEEESQGGVLSFDRRGALYFDQHVSFRL